MELTQHDFLEELLAPKRDSWTPYPDGVNEILRSGWNSQSFDHSQHLATSNSSLLGEIISPPNSSFAFPFGEPYPIADNFSLRELGSSFHEYALQQMPIQEEFGRAVEDGQVGLLVNGLQGITDREDCFKNIAVEQPIASADANATGLRADKKSKVVKKVQGQPSKNLMAERRRRKRLNDRLSMLRSIVPKISKMDRTSILGDTIDYMRELLDKIHKLREENMEEDTSQMNMVGGFKELEPNEVLVRNPPKFDVERRNLDTRIEICCTMKPGLLLSTVSTLEALGLDIQQCVISCFNDFSVQASCSEVVKHQGFISPEDMKQALFRNAGYGGRSL